MSAGGRGVNTSSSSVICGEIARLRDAADTTEIELAALRVCACPSLDGGASKRAEEDERE